MERRAKEERSRRGYQNPSFASTLLDAIYRSIDESDADGAPDAAPAAVSSGQWRAAAVTGPVSLPRLSTSSSSDNSSFGGFSSEPGSAASHRARIRASRPPPPQRVSSPQPAAHHRDKTKSSAIGSKIRDTGRLKAPVSPGARFASFLNSLFAKAAGKPRKSNTASDNAPYSTAAPVANYSGSCLVKTASSTRKVAEDEGVLKQSLRFHPTANVMLEGQQRAYDGEGTRTKEKKKRREGVRKRVEELLRGLEEEEEMSDSSSDLFELENLTVEIGGYMDELPVYETTHLGSTSRAISSGLH
ncbi:protein BIG GRAIN 1-like [Canna indica]|uniref:Protein BIG GRAIN 1-like n=1 Tax=Canna indica TaxID=4628 RepID=A0AAQ3KC98_9LILI|nr:protein BIG GRAIN 1-like [Canna indica]